MCGDEARALELVSGRAQQPHGNGRYFRGYSNGQWNDEFDTPGNGGFGLLALLVEHEPVTIVDHSTGRFLAASEGPRARARHGALSRQGGADAFRGVGGSAGQDGGGHVSALSSSMPFERFMPPGSSPARRGPISRESGSSGEPRRRKGSAGLRAAQSVYQGEDALNNVLVGDFTVEGFIFCER